jgi:SAP domain
LKHIYKYTDREWFVVTDEYVLVGRRSKDIDDYTIEYIQKRLLERSSFKAERDYEAADTIRDELKNDYSVKIDDRTREFSFVINEFSIIDNNNNNNGEIRENRIFRSQPKQPQATNEDDDIPDSVFDFLDDIPEQVESASSIEKDVVVDDDTTNISTTSNDDESMMNDDNTTDVLGNDYTSMTVVQLKDLLRENGLPVSGNKAELINRLQAIE